MIRKKKQIRNFLKWITSTGNIDTPPLTPEITSKYVLKNIEKSNSSVFYFVIDCLRLDQWLIMEKHLSEYFKIEKDYYYSILPTATPYARNALFSGLYPSEIEKNYPQYWAGEEAEDEKSMNRYEKELLQHLLDRKKIKLRNELKYLKIIDPDVGRNFEQNILSYQNTHLTAVVINFLDMIAHGRSDSDILKEIDRKSTRLNSSHLGISYAVFCLKKKYAVCGMHGPIPEAHASLACPHPGGLC